MTKIENCNTKLAILFITSGEHASEKSGEMINALSECHPHAPSNIQINILQPTLPDSCQRPIIHANASEAVINDSVTVKC